MKPQKKPQAGIHRLADHIGMGDAIKVAVAGAGGNGSQMVSRLAVMAGVMRRLGMPRLDVDLYDPDRVSPSNVGRQLFLEREEGQYKALALIQRANCSFGLQWQAFPEKFVAQHYRAGRTRATLRETGYDFLITCVDSGAARKAIFDAAAHDPFAPHYWLDLANEADHGQVLLGEMGDLLAGGRTRLPTVVERYPDYYDGSIPETDVPSCSLEESLLKQSLFINDHIALWARTLLWELLRGKQTDKVGYFVNLRDGTANALKAPAERDAMRDLRAGLAGGGRV